MVGNLWLWSMHALSDSLEIDFVLLTVQRLIEKHGAELKTDTLIHSDQGSHYTSYAFSDILKSNNLRQSMSRKANCWDNAPQESFFGHMKDEINISDCFTHEEICEAVEDWIDYYSYFPHHQSKKLPKCRKKFRKKNSIAPPKVV